VNAAKSRRNAKALALLVASLGLYLAADLGTKEWALDNLARARAEKPPLCEPDARGRISYQNAPLPSRPFIEGFIDLHYAENCGAAFSMLGTAPAWLRALVFGGVGVAAAGIFLLMFIRGAGGPPFALAVPLILSGALGNLTDRVRHGFVVDFIQIDPRLFDYPTMNVADIWIAIGVALVVIDGFRKPRPPVEERSA